MVSLVILILAVTTIGCVPPLNPTPDPDPDPTPTAPDETYANDLLDFLLTSFEADASFSDADVETSKDAGLAALTEESLNESENLEEMLPVAVGGIQGDGFPQLSLSGNELTLAVEILAENAVRAVNFEPSAGSASIASSRSIGRRALTSEQIQSVLGRVTEAIMGSLDEAGADSGDDDGTSTTAEAGMRAIIRNLGDDGANVTLAELGDVVDTVTAAAIRMSASSGADSEAKVRNFVRRISRAAVSTVTQTRIAGLDGATVANAARRVANAATRTLNEVSTEVTVNVVTVAQEVTAGAAEAIGEISNDVGFAADTGRIMRDLAAGAAEAANDLAGDDTEKKKQVVKALARAAAEGIARTAGANAGVDTDSVVADAIRGLAEGAARGGTSADDAKQVLREAIAEAKTTIQDEASTGGTAGEITLDDTAVDSVANEGEAAADNTSPTVELGTTSVGGEVLDEIILEIVAADDDGDTLTIQWAIVGWPEDLNRAPTLSGTTTSTVSFTPQMAGVYTLSVAVSDGIAYPVSLVIEIDVDEATLPTLTESQLNAAWESLLTKLQYRAYDDDGNFLSVPEMPDVDAAYTQAANVLLTNPDDARFALAFALIDIAGMVTDPLVGEFAREVAGISNYPTSLGGLVATSIDATISGEFPSVRVEGSVDQNGNGKTDSDEVLRAIRARLKANLFLNDVSERVATLLNDRAETITTLVESLPEDAQVSFDYGILAATESDAIGFGWPFGEDTDDDGFVDANPAPVVIGKAEMQVMAAQLEMLAAFANLATVYDYTLGRDYIASLVDALTDNSDAGGPPTSDPLAEGFGSLRAEATANLTEAKDAMVRFTDLVEAAASTVAARDGSDFTVDAQTLLFADEWDSGIEPALLFTSILASKMRDSIEDSTVALNVPVPYNVTAEEYFSTYSDEANWPTTGPTWDTEGGTSYLPSVISGFPGVFFAEPFGGIAAVIQINDNTGNPTFYQWSNESMLSPIFSRLTESQAGDAARSGDWVYVRIQDITIGGTVPFANYYPGSVAEFNAESGYVLMVANADGSISAYFPTSPTSVLSAVTTPESTYHSEARRWRGLGSFWGYLLHSGSPLPVLLGVDSASTDIVNSDSAEHINASYAEAGYWRLYRIDTNPVATTVDSVYQGVLDDSLDAGIVADDLSSSYPDAHTQPILVSVDGAKTLYFVTRHDEMGSYYLDFSRQTYKGDRTVYDYSLGESVPLLDPADYGYVDVDEYVAGE